MITRKYGELMKICLFCKKGTNKEKGTNTRENLGEFTSLK